MKVQMPQVGGRSCGAAWSLLPWFLGLVGVQGRKRRSGDSGRDADPIAIYPCGSGMLSPKDARYWPTLPAPVIPGSARFGGIAPVGPSSWFSSQCQVGEEIRVIRCQAMTQRKSSFPSPPTSRDAGPTSLPGMQVSISRVGRAHSFILFTELRRRSELRSAPVIRANHAPPRYFQKCVPGPSRCVRCTRMEIQDCIYEPVKKRGVGKTLRMGEACACCRLARPHGDTERRADIRLPPRRPPEQKRG
jgi:hypothetical protein